MLRSFEDFRASINNLLAHLEYENSSNLFFRDGISKLTGNSKIEVELRSFIENVVSHSVSRTRTYSYQNAIISLYGYLERYIEETITEYLTCITDACQDFLSLPQAIRKNHLTLSLDLIAKIQKARGWSDHTRKERLSKAVGNINHFLGEQGTPKINYEAFTSHTSNFRYETIHDIFNKIGIESISKECVKDPELKATLYEKRGLAPEADADPKVLVSILTAELDDLAQRRNEIAHGVRIDDIDSTDLTISRINLIHSYAKAIKVVVEQNIRQHTLSTSKKIPLGKPDCIFPNHNVIGFKGVKNDHNNSSWTINVGDVIVATNEESTTKNIHAEIITLKLGDKEITTTLLPCDEDLSMKLSCDLGGRFHNRTIYLLTPPSS